MLHVKDNDTHREVTHNIFRVSSVATVHLLRRHFLFPALRGESDWEQPTLPFGVKSDYIFNVASIWKLRQNGSNGNGSAPYSRTGLATSF